jgi:dolichol-phosphate mannosyltransferase
MVKWCFKIPLNDTTNAFKAYRSSPILSPHFNITVELPLKAIVRGYSYAITPISWQNRKYGVAKLKIKEMGSRYFFICAYIWLEKYFSRGDYKR